MSPNTNPTAPFDLAPRDKIKFVATVLPLLGVLGGVLRATGRSEESVLIVVVPLLFVAFFGWRFAIFMKGARHASEHTERPFPGMRDAQLRQRLQDGIDARHSELRAIRLRQHAEQERLIREHASAEQLGRMMERHRSEYETLLSRRTA